MVVMNIPRAGRLTTKYTEHLIYNMFNEQRSFWKKGFGVCDTKFELIVHSFNSVRNSYGKSNMIKTHYIELFVDYEMDLYAVEMLAEKIGRELYNVGFQSFVSALDTGDGFLIAIALNSVSFVNGDLFHDNNTCYMKIYCFLCGLLPERIELGVTENTFFNPIKKEGNYCHGLLM